MLWRTIGCGLQSQSNRYSPKGSWIGHRRGRGAVGEVPAPGEGLGGVVDVVEHVQEVGHLVATKAEKEAVKKDMIINI